MIRISPEDKAAMQRILENYTRSKFDEVLKEAGPVLRKYYDCPPERLGKRLLNSLFTSWLNKPNEAFVHYWALCRLVTEYGYPKDQLDEEVSCGELGRRATAGSGGTLADIVIYSHESRRPGTALVAVECREPGGPDGVAQAASYSRALQARYHLFTDTERWDAFRTQPHPVDGVPISDIPRWVGYKPIRVRLSKAHSLPPLTDEQQLREFIKACHDSIHAEGIDPAKAFDELVKLFFVKVFDEQEVPDLYQFSVLEGETEEETANHIRKLLKDARTTSKYKELFVEPGDDEFWISNRSIRKVVETFQTFSFTADSVIGIDTKGTVYEKMVGSTFRGELGQYFTPRKIVDFMVGLLDPSRDDIVLDPACGSGGFLIDVLKKVGTKIRLEQQNLPQHKVERIIDQFVNNNVFGTDISPRMVRAARMNMIMHGDGWSGIQRWHGLKIQQQHFLGPKVGKFTLILSNPPFAGFETDGYILTNYETGKNEAGRVRGVNRAIVFVEQIIRLLAEGGRAGLVLPRSIFENESYSFRKLRELIYEQCKILALVGLPKTAFHHTDCGILGDLLFIEKVAKKHKNPKDYDVFIAWAEHVGYDTLGHNISENDLPVILDLYRDRYADNFVPISKLKAEDNLNAWHYHAKARRLRTQIKRQSDLVPLTALISVYNNRISRAALRQTPERRLRYVEVRDFDPETGNFGFTERTIQTLPSRATYEMNGEEVLLLPNARNSLESGRRVVRVDEELRGYILTNRFLPLIPKVNPQYLVMILNTDFVRSQFIAVCRGAGSPDFREGKLRDIMIPVPNKEDLSSIDSFMETIVDKSALREQLRDELNKVVASIDRHIQSLYRGK